MADPARDYSILRAMAAAIEATGEFERVLIGERPTADRTQFAAEDVPAAVITPRSFAETDNWDDASDVQSERTMQVAITLVVRDTDESARIDLLDRLGHAVAQAIGGECLAGLTIVGKTRVRAGEWAPAVEPEKHLVLSVETSYLIDGFDGYDDGEYEE